MGTPAEVMGTPAASRTRVETLPRPRSDPVPRGLHLGRNGGGTPLLPGLLCDIAAGQGGVLSWPQLHRAGLSPSEVSRLVAHEVLVRVRRGGFVTGEVWRAADPDRRFALRVRAALLVRPHDAASHQAAFALSELPLWGVDLRRVDLQARVTRRRAKADLRLHPWDDAARLELIGGARALAIAEAAPLVAAAGSLEGAVVAVDAALRRGYCTVEELADVVARLDQRSCPGVDRARRMIAVLDPRSESAGESRVRVFFMTWGVPWASQVTIRDARGQFVARVDFLIDRWVVVEFDGRTKYDDPQVLWAEKRREDALRALGYEVVRLTWSDLNHPERVARLIREARGRAAARVR